MDDAYHLRLPGSCPHVDRNDQRCATRFSLGRIDQAFCVCFGAYAACPMYHQISRELSTAATAPDGPPLITVTTNGHALPLRATGT